MFTPLLIAGTEVIVYRDDLNHPTVSGNKLHKLTPNIAFAKARGCNTVLSFGGPYSNHLHALAWACKEAGFLSIGVVRGELHASLTPTLKDCRKWGMKLIASSRKDYRAYQECLAGFSEPCLANELNLEPVTQSIDCVEQTLVVPEGGSNKVAIESLANAYRPIFDADECQGITHVVCATGTGATLAGLFKASPKHIEVIGVQAVAENGATLKRIHTWLGEELSRLTIQEGHLGRFAKMPTALMAFIEAFQIQHSLPLDPVYTGKVMFKLTHMIESGYFANTDKILFMHTGGLQGKRYLQG